jgi:hypothetical protein
MFVMIATGSAVVRVALQCVDCQCQSMSDPILVDLSGMRPNDVPDLLNNTRVGSHHPVGWTSCLGPGGKTVYRCPNCKK